MPHPEPTRASISVAAALAALGLLAAVHAHAAAGVEVTAFSPQGTVKGPSQVTARFSAAMVPFGDLHESVVPFEVSCTGAAAAGAGRWIDATLWSMDFPSPLPAGVRCTFSLADGLRAHDGREVAGKRSWSFTTGAPVVTRSAPWEGSESIEEDQVFLLSLDGEVDPASVRASAGFSVEGLPERIEADLLGDAELATLVAGLDEWSKPSAPFVALRARRAFPNGKKVTLVWGPGIRSASGETSTEALHLAFRTRPAFSARVSCTKENARSGCVPLLAASLDFSAPIPSALAREVRLVAPDGAELAPVPAGGGDDTTTRLRFAAPFAEKTRYAVRLPAGLRDDSGRTLDPGLRDSLAVETGPMPVLAKFATRFGIVEREAGPALPVTLRNVESMLDAKASRPVAMPEPGLLESVLASVRGRDLHVDPDDPRAVISWLQRVAVASRRRSVFEATQDGAAPRAQEGAQPAAKGAATRDFTLPKPLPASETEVVGIPLEGAGLHVVEIASPRLGAALLAGEAGATPVMHVPAAALVTGLAVHFKRGRESSLAWVTSLADASPVAGARVSVHDCRGEELASARSDADGVARFEDLPAEEALPSCWESMRPDENDHTAWSDLAASPALSGLSSGLFVFARTEDDLGLVHTSWKRGIEAWRFDLPSAPWRADGPVVHTVFDRPVYRAGETVHAKHFVRLRTMDGLEVPSAKEVPKTLAIRHRGSGDAWTLPFEMDARGIAIGEWRIPPGAKTGHYDLSLEAEDAQGTRSIEAGELRVEQFRVPLVRGELSLPASPGPSPSSVPVDVSVRYLSGGSAGGAPVTVRAELRPGWFEAPEGLEAWRFAAGRVREGVTRPGEEEGARTRTLPRHDVRLDEGGSARVTLEGLGALEGPTDLVVEAEFRDPNGETVTVGAARTLLPSSRVVGLRVDDWTGVGEAMKPRVIVLDPRGAPVAGAEVRVELARSEWFSHRKRLVGGFYAYEHRSETKRTGPLCKGVTDAEGRFSCDAPSPGPGSWLVEAVVVDEGGRESATHASAWVAGAESTFATEPSDRIDLLPEKPSWKPGETARLQVRMPFREATVLVTVEREGVGEARVVRLDSTNPVIEVPVRAAHAPNVFVSALVVRGRVGEAQPTATLDLARPAFRLGIAELRVDATTRRLDVEVKPERETWEVREKARVRLRVRRGDGSAPSPGTEVAVTAIDEGLLELASSAGWDPLATMTGRRPCEVETSSAQGQVVGKRHYGRKAVAAGGGGGRGPTRELFETLLLWSPRVALDANGEAEVEVPLGDALTGHRIVAVASGEPDEFGHGAATIRTTRELSVLSGLAPLLRGGDEVEAEFTLRNSGLRRLDVRATVEVTGADLARGERPPGLGEQPPGLAEQPPGLGEKPVELEEKRVALEPGEARVVAWRLRAPVHPAGEEATLAWEVRASADGGAGDALRVSQRVLPPLPVRVVQSTLARTRRAEPWSTPLRLPDDASAGVLEVRASASLVGALDPVRAWLARYPYACLEQRVSVAVGRGDEAAWNRLVEEFGAYVDGDGLLRWFPGDGPGDDRLTAYVLALTRSSHLRLPASVEARLVEGLEAFVAGSLTRASALERPDLTLRKLSAIAALAKAGRAKPSMLDSLEAMPETWPTSALLDWWTILGRVMATDREAKMARAEAIVRSRLQLSGTSLAFSTEAADSLWWMMASPDANAARLLLLLVERGAWKEETPRLARGLLERRRDGAWSTTVANAWGVLALRAFSSVFEKDEVTGTTVARLRAADAASPPAVEGRIEWPPAEPEAWNADWPLVGGAATAPPLVVTTAPSPQREAVDPPALALPLPAGDRSLEVEHEGGGAPWITVTASAALPAGPARSAGYRVRRSVEAVEPRRPGAWSRGDRVRVRLEIEADRDMEWVVVDDPVPAGATHLGSGLGRGPRLEDDPATGDAGSTDAARIEPTFVDRKGEAWVAYFRALPKGRYVLEHTLRLQQAGTFSLPPTRVEALYAPDLFGEAPNAAVTVEP